MANRYLMPLSKVDTLLDLHIRQRMIAMLLEAQVQLRVKHKIQIVFLTSKNYFHQLECLANIILVDRFDTLIVEQNC